MARVRTQDDFVKKAVAIHGDVYDYSEVKYQTTKDKVKIICPVHGIFEQAPLHHLRGQGCKRCGQERTKTGFDEFVRRAREVHGDVYDYSKVVYVRSDVKVEIVCPIHGPFWQKPHNHIMFGQRCPVCGHGAAGLKRTGDRNAMRRDNVKEKVRNTCMKKYGAKTYAESDEGRAKLHDIITSPVVADKMVATCMARYGAPIWSQSSAGRERLHEIMSSDDMKTKIISGYRNKYGMDHYMQTETARLNQRVEISRPEHRRAIMDGIVRKYGVKSALSDAAVREKACRTMFARYGVPHSFMSHEIMAKSWLTKRRNGTINTSGPENDLYVLLCLKFGSSDVCRQYNEDSRYPFFCDFYIRSLDLFIELNASWTHGGHWFDERNFSDVQTLMIWHEKARSSRYYEAAIETWTVRDVLKRQTAIWHNLNYLVFWDNDLTDVNIWLNTL